MSKLFEKINQDLKAAMMAKDAFSLSVLRMLIAALRNKEITLRPAFSASWRIQAGGQGGKAELSDEQVVEVVASEIKKRREAIELYVKGGRQELADKEAAEIKILEKYLPARLLDEELEKIIKEIIAAGATDFGRVMGQAMAKVKGQADGAKVGELVKKLLAK